jgi:hypothetical protein
MIDFLSDARRTMPISEIAADLHSPSGYHLFPGSRIVEFQSFAPDPLLTRARVAWALRTSSADSCGKRVLGWPEQVPVVTISDEVAAPIEWMMTAVMAQNGQIISHRPVASSYRRRPVSRAVLGPGLRRDDRKNVQHPVPNV